MVKEIEELRVYKLAEEIADSIWNICIKWDYFSKQERR